MKTVSEKKFYYHVVKSPIGKLYILSSPEYLEHVYFENEKMNFDIKASINKVNAEINKALNFFNLYFSSGKNSELKKSASQIKFNFEGFTPNEVSVYKKLLEIPFSETISYKNLAAGCGFPQGARFIGNCMAKNRFPVIIPCHRVIKSDGSAGNYSGGQDIKLKLLEHEGNI